MKRRWASPLMRRLAVHEWFVLLAGMLLLALGLGWQNGLGRMDLMLYDQFVSAQGRPARDDIIIVAIDDDSLAQLGKWPWPRNLHAELINKITLAHPRAIGLDVILSEPERPQINRRRPGDQALTQALASNRLTVLPMAMASSSASLSAALPIPELADAAQSIGHINLELDADGVVRSVFLRQGQNQVWWPHFALAMFNLDAKNSAIPNTDSAYASTERHGNLHAQAGAPQHLNHWQHADRMHIPFSGGSGSFKSVPYAAVLRGEVDAQFFAGKYVLIGATAIGMADSYPTPVSGIAGAMAGIEINANILASLLDGKSIAIASAWLTALFSVMPVIIALLGYLLLPPRTSLFVTAGLLLLTGAASYLALRNGVWIAPAAALITLVVSYPLWSWRRLEAAIAYLGQEFIRLDQEPHLLPEAPVHQPELEDALERRINAMKNAARRVRDLRQFMSDSLDNLPDASLVTDMQGRVLLANRHAHDYFASIGVHQLQDVTLFDLLPRLNSPQPVDQPPNFRFRWSHLFDLQHISTLASGVSARDEHGRDLLIKSAPYYSTARVLTGWIVSMIDISSIRSTERSRDETLRFLSHDMRAPQASILALLELQNEPDSALSQQEFFARIEQASRKTLGLADNFVQLARAESQEYRLEEVDFRDVLFDATDEMWSLAKTKHIEIATDIAEDEYPVHVDRALMTRALTNLLSNAINYSPEHTRIVCSVYHQDMFYLRQIVCSIRDQGYGIAADDQIKLFRRFHRVNAPHQPRHDGIGLGLVFVKTVTERHHGKIVFSSKVGEGTTFTLILPCYQGK